MDSRAEELTEEMKENKVVDLRLIKGGKEPPATGSDWLTPLEKGTLFFVQNKQTADFNLGLFWKAEMEGKVVKLVSPMIPNPIYVNPVRFCNVYMIYENCGIVDYKQEEMNSHEQRDPLAESDGVERPEGQ